jgi:5-methylthioadenosine/S-adenosylhomocysteine deaminase
MDLLDEARLATLFATAREGRHDALATAHALELATLGGARALGLAGEIGTLEVGKAADMAAFPIPAHRVPIHDPIAAAVYSLAGLPATFVAVAGRVRVRDGHLVDADAELPRRVQASADLLQRWLVG